MKSQVVLEKESKKAEEIILKGTDKPESTRIVLHLLLGLLTGFFPQEYMVSPFCAAAVGASGEYAFVTFVGGSLGYIMSRGVFPSLRYIALLCVIMLSVSLLSRKFKTISDRTIAIFFSTALVFAFDIAFAFLGEFAVSSVIFAFADAMLCAAGVYFFHRSLGLLSSGASIRNLSNIDALCLVIGGAAILCSISSVKVMNISPAHIFASFLILFSAYYKKAAGASVAGIIIGSVLSLNGDVHILYMYALGGLLGGVFAAMGQYAVAVAFVAVSGMVTLIMQGDINALYGVIESAVAAIAFVAIPSKWLNRVLDYLEKTGVRTDSEVNMQVALNLRSAAETVNEVTDIVNQVTKQMDNIINPEITKVYAKIQHNVCADCQYKSFCWNDNFSYTVKDIEEIAKLRLEGKDRLPEKLPYALETRCDKLRLLSQEVEESYADYMESTDYRLKLDEMRSIVADQFSSMSLLLYDVSKQLSASKTYNENKSRAIKLALCENSVIVHNSAYYENEFSRAVVEVGVYEEPSKINHKKIQRIVSQTVQKNFKQSEISIVDFVTVLTFTQKPQYDIICGFKQIAKGDNRLCGDQFETLDDINGNTVVILSDGMGTGKRAAIDATMTCSLMHKLLGSGFTFESALRLVNSALLIKSRDESLSTVDAVSINAYSGKCDFYKAGATVSYIRHKDEITVVKQSSLPVGILRDVEFAQSTFELKKGDIVLLLSDGAVGEDDSWIEDELLSWSTDNMQELACHIADMARLKNLPSFADDITAIALKLKRA